MAFSNLISLEHLTWTIGILSGILCIVLYNVVSFYIKVRKYPKGPTPLPIVGNLLHFRGRKLVHETLLSFEEKYGPVFTVWLGPTPNVFITDPQLILDTFKQKSCSGRPQMSFPEELFGKGGIDIAFSDFNKGWEVLRRVAFAAIRKYAVSDSLPKRVVPAVDEALANMHKDGVFLPSDHLAPMVFSITAGSALGKDYSLGDPELRKLREWINYVGDTTPIIYLVGAYPFFKVFFYKQWNRLVDAIVSMRNFVHDRYLEHEQTFDEQVTRDFTDAMIHAKREAEKEDSHQSEYLTPDNITNSINDLMFASDTTKGTLDWWFIFSANWPEKQEKMRKEIESVLDEEEIPTIALRERCPYTVAFLAETIRYRSIGPINFPHKAMEDVTINGHKIPAGTALVSVTVKLLHDKGAWTDPEDFRPERFLDEDGKFNPRPNSFYIPFSGGRRGCIGERLALSNLFLITTRLLQKTRGYRFLLDGYKTGNARLGGDVDNMRMFGPHPTKIRMEKVYF